MTTSFFKDLDLGHLVQLLGAMARNGFKAHSVQSLSDPKNARRMQLLAEYAEALANEEPYLPDIDWTDSVQVVISRDHFTYLTSSVRVRMEREHLVKVEALRCGHWADALPFLFTDDQTEHELLPVVRFRLREHTPVLGRDSDVFMKVSYPDFSTDKKGREPRDVAVVLDNKWSQVLPGLMAKIDYNQSLQVMVWSPRPGFTGAITGSTITGTWNQLPVDWNPLAAWVPLLPGFESGPLSDRRTAFRSTPTDE